MNIWDDVLKPLLVLVLFLISFFYIFESGTFLPKIKEKADNAFLQVEDNYENLINSNIGKKDSLFFLEVNNKNEKSKYATEMRKKFRYLLISLMFSVVVIILIVVISIMFFKGK